MNHKWSAAALSLMLGATFPAHALPPTYSFIEMAYLAGEGSGFDTEGVRGAVSLTLAPWLYFTGEYDYRDFKDTPLDQRFGSAGFGIHTVGKGFQLFGAATYERQDLNGTGGNDLSDDGYGLLGGARLPIGPFLELQGDYKYVDVGELPNGDRNDDSRVRGTLLAHLTKNVSIAGSYYQWDDADLEEWTAGFRFHFTAKHDPRRN